jgi:hypothetical protein
MLMDQRYEKINKNSIIGCTKKIRPVIRTLLLFLVSRLALVQAECLLIRWTYFIAY